MKIKDYKKYPRLYEHLMSLNKKKTGENTSISEAFRWDNTKYSVRFYNALDEGVLDKAKELEPSLFNESMTLETLKYKLPNLKLFEIKKNLVEAIVKSMDGNLINSLYDLRLNPEQIIIKSLQNHICIKFKL